MTRLGFLRPSLPLACFGLALLLLAACSGGNGLALGEICQGDAECASGLCHETFTDAYSPTCASRCEIDADCPAESTCGTLEDGSRACLGVCDPLTTYAEGFVCVGNALTACEHAGDARDCSSCGCPDDKFCDALWRTSGPGQCLAGRSDGEPCVGHEECASGNCSKPLAGVGEPGFCQVARAQPCTDANCIDCDWYPDGNLCTQTCNSNTDCATGEACMVTSGEDFGHCRQTCPSCPFLWSCELTSDQTIAYCDPPEACDPEASLPCGAFETCHSLYHVCYGD